MTDIRPEMLRNERGVALPLDLTRVPVDAPIARQRDPVLAGRLVVAGSVIVVAAGTYWFVQRVFFPGAA